MTTDTTTYEVEAIFIVAGKPKDDWEAVSRNHKTLDDAVIMAEAFRANARGEALPPNISVAPELLEIHRIFTNLLMGFGTIKLRVVKVITTKIIMEDAEPMQPEKVAKRDGK